MNGAGPKYQVRRLKLKWNESIIPSMARSEIQETLPGPISDCDQDCRYAQKLMKILEFPSHSYVCSLC
jgi:hypothetical protein